jgi:abhydrolase domain-containing protein 17
MKKSRIFILYFLLVPTVYILGSLIASFLVEKLMYPVPVVGYADDEHIVKLTTTNNIKISARYWENDQATYVILYSHGNGEDIAYSQPLLEPLVTAGFSVFAYDYAGYGTSLGSPSVEQTYFDIEAAYSYLVEEKKIPPDHIIVYGRSIGGGPSVYLASRKPIGGLILESTFVGIFQVAHKLLVLPFDKYPSAKPIGKVKEPILIIHGDSDKRISYWHAQTLFAAANEPKELLIIPDAGHNDLHAVAGSRYLEALAQFKEKLEQK